MTDFPRPQVCPSRHLCLKLRKSLRIEVTSEGIIRRGQLPDYFSVNSRFVLRGQILAATGAGNCANKKSRRGRNHYYIDSFEVQLIYPPGVAD